MTTFEAEAASGGQLRRALRVRHLVMLAVGGTIASGFLLFAGSYGRSTTWPTRAGSSPTARSGAAGRTRSPPRPRRRRRPCRPSRLNRYPS